jgi:hypothetical protein
MAPLNIAGRPLCLVGLVILAGLSAACSSSSPPTATRGIEPSGPAASQVVLTRLIYTPPSGPPGNPAVVSGDGAPAQVLSDVAEALRSRGVTVTQFDPERGFLAATVSRNPQEYIDCGWIVQLAADGSTQQYPGSSPRLRLRAHDQGQASTARHLLEMEVRVVVTAASSSANRVRLVGAGDFVLIKTIEDELTSLPQRAVIYFKTGQRDNFPEEMMCQSTGRLEREILNLGMGVRVTSQDVPALGQ